MQFFTLFTLSAMLMTTAFAQRGIGGVRADACDPTPQLPALDLWAQNRFTTIVEAANATALTAAFNAFWSKDVSITLNGVAISTADYQAKRMGRGYGGTIQYMESIAVPTMANSSEEGEVSLFFNNDINGSNVTSAINLVIRPDLSVPGPDNRRVQVLDQVLYGL
ncbi:hypothetical protein B0H16DRAFT_1704431 [Mycena metata]|uniref:Uncharacterized protein n=1 Tax=Mycena metata TaxID=1033252 RepID=A0AAD7GW39_9AGAR|nr:hypothetical protein B0H16DRAFT_1704431 [Mycena metata]